MARPRSVRAHEQVLDAALKLFAERGIDATSMDAIAEASGVSKATIYKHWPDKDALCLEVITRLHGLEEEEALQASEDTRADLIAVLSHRPAEESYEMKNRLMPHIIAYGARNPAFGAAWRSRVLEPARTQLKQVLKQAVAAGELAADLDYELALALLIGPMMYRHIFSLQIKKMPKEMPERVVEAFLKGHIVTAAPRKRNEKTRKTN